MNNLKLVMKSALFAAIFLAGLLLPYGNKALAAQCPNNDCTGWNTDAYGCISQTALTEYRGNAKLELRRSPSYDCDAEWARVTNNTYYNLYVGASARYGGSQYNYHQDITTPGAIGPYQNVHTTAVGHGSITNTVACGKANSSSVPVPIPYDVNLTYCTHAN